MNLAVIHHHRSRVTTLVGVRSLMIGLGLKLTNNSKAGYQIHKHPVSANLLRFVLSHRAHLNS